MRRFTVFFFLLFTTILFAQSKVKGVVYNELSYNVEPGVNIINLSNLKVTQSKTDGSFTMDAVVGDTLHFSAEGYRSLKLRVTNDWVKGHDVKVYIKDASTVLDEIIINQIRLTGFLQVDTKLIALSEYPYTRDYSATGASMFYNNGFNPINGIYNLIKRNSKSTQRLNEIKKETELIELMKTKYDRETVSALLNISKEDIVTTLQRCNHSERFIYTASDFQIFNAINECFEHNKQ